MESSTEGHTTSVITEVTEISSSSEDQPLQMQEVSESSTTESPPPAPFPSEEVTSAESEQP